jgi:probable HAF family extracellular repeat protein
MSIIRHAIAVIALAGTAAAQVEYTVEIIQKPEGVLGFTPWGINNLGDVVGIAATGQGYRAAVRWNDGTFEVLPEPENLPKVDWVGPFTTHRAVKINDSRQIVGRSDADGWFYGSWIYEDGLITPIPALYDNHYYDAWDINNEGEVVGTAWDGGFTGFKPVYWSEETGPVDILPGLYSFATSISENGWISGAFRAGWRTRLGQEPQFFEEIRAYPAINNDGNVISGGPGPGDPFHYEAFFYSDQTGETQIANYGEDDLGWAINNSNVAVGDSTDPVRAWEYRPGIGARLLDTLIDPALGLNIGYARDINDDGVIVGGGFVVQSGESIAVILTPVGDQECAPDLTGDGTLDLFDFLAFTNLFNAGDLLADFDHNGVLDLFDFLAFTNVFNAGC